VKARALCGALALLLWGAAWLLPERLAAGRDWWLLDASASMAGAAPPPAAAADPERTRWFARGLARSAAAEEGREESALGAALLSLRPELRAGDRLHVWTDGRSSDALPPRALFSDCQIVAHAPPPGPRLTELRAPPAWPADGRIALAARVLDAQFAAAEIAVESAPGAVELLRAEPVAGGWVRLEIRALDAAAPPGWLRLRWREGGRSTARAVAIAPPPAAAWPVADPARWSERESQQVRAGATLLLAHAELGAWLAVPEEFRPFAAGELESPVLILLDRSGSMDAGAWDEARALLTGWAREFGAGAGLRVQTFAENLEAPLDLRKAEDRARLAALLPFGRTRLAAALEEACAGLPADATLILISDGRADAPAEGWEAWSRRVIGARSLLCVAVGADPDRATLAHLGARFSEGAFRERLQQAFERLREPRGGPAFAQPGASLPLPDRWDAPAPRAALAAAPGAELLLADAAGGAVLSLRRAGAGAVLGLAAPANAGWPAELRAAAAASRVPASGWFDGRLLVSGGPPPPRVAQGGRPLDLLLLDSGPPARWEARGADPRLPARVADAAAASAWILPPSADLEWTADDSPWRSWAAEGAESRNRGGPRPTLLVAALVAASLAFFLADRARS